MFFLTLGDGNAVRNYDSDVWIENLTAIIFISRNLCIQLTMSMTNHSTYTPTITTIYQENQLYNRIMGLTSKNFGQLQKVYNPPVNAYVSVKCVQLNNGNA